MKTATMLVASGISMFLSVGGRIHQSCDSIKVVGSNESIFIPSNESIKNKKSMINVAKYNFTDYPSAMRTREFITENVISNVKVELIGDSISPDLKVCYEYSLTNDSASFLTGDYELGKYKVSDSDAALTTLDIMKNTLEYNLSAYLKHDKKVTIVLIGYADAVPIKSPIGYQGDYGSEIEEFCIVNNTLQKIKISSDKGIMTNEELAFMRSYMLRQYITAHVPLLSNTRNTFRHIANVSDACGGQYRRVAVEIIFHDFLKDPVL